MIIPIQKIISIFTFLNQVNDSLPEAFANVLSQKATGERDVDEHKDEEDDEEVLAEDQAQQDQGREPEGDVDHVEEET